MSDLPVPANFDNALVPTVRDTLREVLGDPTLNQTFGGRDKQLSQAQAGLAAAVTVLMQDRLMHHIRESHRRELGLIAGFWNLYRTPMFQFPSQKAGASPQSTSTGDSRDESVRSGLAGLLSWGNVFAGSALIVVALAFYYTKLTSSYKDNWERAESDLKVLRERFSSEEKANEALQTELGKLQSRAETAESSLRSLSALSVDQQKTLQALIEDLSAKRGEIAKQVASSSGERKFQKLYESTADELKRAREAKATAEVRAKECQDRLPTK